MRITVCLICLHTNLKSIRKSVLKATVQVFKSDRYTVIISGFKLKYYDNNYWVQKIIKKAVQGFRYHIFLMNIFFFVRLLVLKRIHQKERKL